jgi:hypothetical protein
VKKLLRRVLVPLLLLVPLTGCTGGLLCFSQSGAGSANNLCLAQ